MTFTISPVAPTTSIAQALRVAALAAAATLLALAGGAAHAQAYVNATVVGELAPGVYGRIVIGNAPPPPVIYAEPIIIQRPTVVVPRSPIYLYVPPGHAKNWAKHCSRYNACGQPVYFVQEPPRGGYKYDKHEKHEKGHKGDKGNKHRDERQWTGDDRGQGNGRGEGRGKGNGNRD
jgi:hypothetical protein